MKTLIRFVVPAVVALGGVLAQPDAGSAQPEQVTSPVLAGDWEILVRPRLGFFAPQWDYAAGRKLPLRPSFGVELVMRPRESWYGGRALFEQTTPWNINDIPYWPDSSPQPQHFQSGVVDAVVYPVRIDLVRAYFFGGAGFKSLSVTNETGVLPYSFSGSLRKATLHGGFGIEIPVEGARAVFEVGDYYGETREVGKVHDVHVTFMLGFPGIGDFIRSLGGDESD